MMVACVVSSPGMALLHPTESGLVVPVPSLQDFVATWRPRVDRIPPIGIPAHITLLYPFVPPVEIEAEIDDLRGFFAGQSRFSYSLIGIDWFGDEVVFVKPSPSAGFTCLTAAIHKRWNLPPYGGTIEQPQPHVTIGVDGPADLMRDVAEAGLKQLPIHEQATEAWLMQGTPDPPEWSITHRFRLGQ